MVSEAVFYAEIIGLRLKVIALQFRDLGNVIYRINFWKFIKHFMNNKIISEQTMENRTISKKPILSKLLS